MCTIYCSVIIPHPLRNVANNIAHQEASWSYLDQRQHSIHRHATCIIYYVNFNVIISVWIYWSIN